MGADRLLLSSLGYFLGDACTKVQRRPAAHGLLDGLRCEAPDTFPGKSDTATWAFVQCGASGAVCHELRSFNFREHRTECR